MESAVERSPGHCTSMGTAGTMVTLAEALGMAPAGSSAIPAMDSRRIVMARDVGEYIMAAVEEDLRPSQIMTTGAFRNAVRVLATIDGAANGVIHLLAAAGRLDVDFKLADFDELSTTTPVLLNLRPSGQYYYNDFFNAGGVPALLNAMGDLIASRAADRSRAARSATRSEAPRSSTTASSARWTSRSPRRRASRCSTAISPRRCDHPGGRRLAGAVSHRGRAVVFTSKEDQDEQLYKPDFDIRPGDIVVVLGGGPKGSAGMPEYGRIQFPTSC